MRARRTFGVAVAVHAVLSLPGLPVGGGDGLSAQEPPPVVTTLSAADSAQAAGLEVWLITIGQGELVYEKFGHNALRIVDRNAGTDLSYNWGIFDFEAPGYMSRFVRGEMMYEMVPFESEPMIQAYIRSDRTVWAQALDLSPEEKLSLQQFVQWNALPENTVYRYDYYRDNCSTRVRDALDRATGGLLRAALEPRSIFFMTYRSETQRLTAASPVWYTALLYALGPYVDRPIDAWEASFVPMRLMEYARELRTARGTPLVTSETVVYQSSRTPPPEAEPERLWQYVVVGLLLGAILLALGLAAHTSRGAATGFVVLAVLWSVLAGVVGTIVLLAWPLTDHVAGYRNENLFQANPLSLMLAFLLPFALFGRRVRRWAPMLATLVAGLAVAGFVLQILPMFDQRNSEIIALALPLHFAVALVVRVRGTRAAG